MSEEKRNIDSQEQPSLPPTITMAKNVVAALAKHVAGGMKKVTLPQFKERIATCNTCPLRLKNRCTHPDCGCFIDVKAWWATEDCPAGKWPKLSE